MPQVLLIGLIILIVIFAIFTGYVLITFLIYMVIKFVKNLINYIRQKSYFSFLKEKYNIDLKINNLSKNLLESQKRLSEARQFELDNNNEILDYKQKLTELKIIKQKCENIYVTNDEMYDLGKKYNAYEPIILNVVSFKIKKERLETKIDRLEGKIEFIEKSGNLRTKADHTYDKRYKGGKDIATINERISKLSDVVGDCEESIDNEITKIIDEINGYTGRIEEIIRIKLKSQYEEVRIIKADYEELKLKNINSITSLEFAHSELVTSLIFILMLGIFYILSLFINISWLDMCQTNC